MPSLSVQRPSQSKHIYSYLIFVFDGIICDQGTVREEFVVGIYSCINDECIDTLSSSCKKTFNKSQINVV